MRARIQLAAWPAMILLGAMCGLAAPTVARAQDPVIDSLEFSDPNIPTATLVKVFPERLTSLWLEALARPEDDYKCQAAATIALAYRRGMPGPEATVGPFMGKLDKFEAGASAGLGIAHSLIILGGRRGGPLLFPHSAKNGGDLPNPIK